MSRTQAIRQAKAEMPAPTGTPNNDAMLTGLRARRALDLMGIPAARVPDFGPLRLRVDRAVKLHQEAMA